MRFFLMQRDHQVAVIEIAEKTGDIIDVAEILSAQRIPSAQNISTAVSMFSPCVNGGPGVVFLQAAPGWNTRWKHCMFPMQNFCSSSAAA